MLAIPERILTVFETGLHDTHVVVAQQGRYKKWLRYYLDFCKKHQLAAGQRVSLPAFLQKLRSKKQSEQQCQQAQSAIELFYYLCKQKRQQVNTNGIRQPAQALSNEQAQTHEIDMVVPLRSEVGFFPKEAPVQILSGSNEVAETQADYTL